jgi:hypothetical protein
MFSGWQIVGDGFSGANDVKRGGTPFAKCAWVSSLMHIEQAAAGLSTHEHSE